MAVYERCKRCGEFGWVASHSCPPRWLVWDPEYEGGVEEAETIFASYEEDAVKKYAHTRTEAGGELFTGNVLIRREDSSGATQEFEVQGYMIPEFEVMSARPARRGEEGA